MGRHPAPQPVWKLRSHHQGLAGRSSTSRGHRAEPGPPDQPGKPMLGAECTDPRGWWQSHTARERLLPEQVSNVDETSTYWKLLLLLSQWNAMPLLFSQIPVRSNPAVTEWLRDGVCSRITMYIAFFWLLIYCHYFLPGSGSFGGKQSVSSSCVSCRRFMLLHQRAFSLGGCRETAAASSKLALPRADTSVRPALRAPRAPAPGRAQAPSPVPHHPGPYGQHSSPDPQLQVLVHFSEREMPAPAATFISLGCARLVRLTPAAWGLRVNCSLQVFGCVYCQCAAQRLELRGFTRCCGTRCWMPAGSGFASTTRLHACRRRAPWGQPCSSPWEPPSCSSMPLPNSKLVPAHWAVVTLSKLLSPSAPGPFAWGDGSGAVGNVLLS